MASKTARGAKPVATLPADAKRPRDADVGSVLGLSFPVERGGVATYARGPGRDAFLARCRRWARAHGARFALP